MNFATWKAILLPRTLIATTWLGGSSNIHDFSQHKIVTCGKTIKPLSEHRPLKTITGASASQNHYWSISLTKPLLKHQPRKTITRASTSQNYYLSIGLAKPLPEHRSRNTITWASTSENHYRSIGLAKFWIDIWKWTGIFLILIS